MVLNQLKIYKKIARHLKFTANNANRNESKTIRHAVQDHPARYKYLEKQSEVGTVVGTVHDFDAKRANRDIG